MATSLAVLLRHFLPPRKNRYLQALSFSLLENPRSLSSTPFRIDAPSIQEEPSPPSPSDPQHDLRTRILRLRFPKRSATAELDKWVSESRKLTAVELRRIARQLKRLQRYKHALEILSWMESRASYRISAPDHAIRLDLISKVYSVAEAEAYFEKIPDSTSQKAACLPLLHYYVMERDLEKAEALMAKLHNLGLTVDPHPFNEMMKLYMEKGQFEEVLAVIRHMKCAKIPRNVLSYNIWMNACCEVSGVSSVERVHEEMVNDISVGVGWSTYSTLANIYTKSGLFAKAFTALREAEGKLSLRNRLGYFFIITNYAALNDRDSVLRLWESSKKVAGRITCANYMCIISCLAKIGDIGEAERVFETWESECRKYDVRVSNVLLGAYMRNGRMDKAESLHLRTLEKGASPNYKTWEILIEGWVKRKQMDKAVDAMKKGFSMLKDCHWRPSSAIVMAIALYFEEQGSVEDAKRYVKVLQRLHLMTLPLYKSFLRVHINTDQAVPNILKMMDRDKIDLDEETRALIQCARKI